MPLPRFPFGLKPWGKVMWRSQTGASLLELIMVVVIAGILIGTAARKISSGATDTQQINAAKTAYHDLQYARNQAMAFGMAVRVVVQPQQNLYSIKWDATGELLTNPITGQPFVRKLGIPPFQFAAIVACDLPENYLVFTSSGKPTLGQQPLEAPTEIMRFTGGHRILVLPYTGQIQLKIHGGED